MTTAPKPRRGRPALPEAERSTVRLPVYTTPVEHAELRAWADREGQPLARLVLDRALRAARRSA